MNPTSNAQLIRYIQNSLQRLSDRARFVSVTWVLSHIGIPGTEVADELASRDQMIEHTHIIYCSYSSALADLYYIVEEVWHLSVKMSPTESIKRYLRFEPSFKRVKYR